jgi:hypothetical protein
LFAEPASYSACVSTMVVVHYNERKCAQDTPKRCDMDRAMSELEVRNSGVEDASLVCRKPNSVRFNYICLTSKTVGWERTTIGGMAQAQSVASLPLVTAASALSSPVTPTHIMYELTRHVA